MAKALQTNQLFLLKAGAAARYQEFGVPPTMAEKLFTHRLGKLAEIVSAAACGSSHGKKAKKPAKKQFAK